MPRTGTLHSHQTPTVEWWPMTQNGRGYKTMGKTILETARRRAKLTMPILSVESQVVLFYWFVSSDFSTNLSAIQPRLWQHLKIFFNPQVKQLDAFRLSWVWPKGSSKPINLNATEMSLSVFASHWTASHLAAGFVVLCLRRLSPLQGAWTERTLGKCWVDEQTKEWRSTWII